MCTFTASGWWPWEGGPGRLLSATSGPHQVRRLGHVGQSVRADVCVPSIPRLRRPHIYRHNTQHAIKAPAWYMRCVHTYRQCLSDNTLSLYLRQFRVVSDVCPALCLSSMGLLDPVWAFFGLTLRTAPIPDICQPRQPRGSRYGIFQKNEYFHWMNNQIIFWMNKFFEWIFCRTIEWINSLNEYFCRSLEWFFEWIKK